MNADEQHAVDWNKYKVIYEKKLKTASVSERGHLEYKVDACKRLLGEESETNK
jgi:hypothetical protein